MIGWLLKNFVQEVPEHLSVCEFDCPNNRCTISDWAACELREQAVLQERTNIRVPVSMVSVDSPIFAHTSLLRPISE